MCTQKIKNGIVTSAKLSNTGLCGTLGHGIYGREQVIILMEVALQWCLYYPNLKTQCNGYIINCHNHSHNLRGKLITNGV